MKFVITHVKNEAYLLRWWLMHHVEKFDHGIVVDYNSTDGSMDLVRKYAPRWEIVQSSNKDFRAETADAEIMHIEQQIASRYPLAWLITLNVTEFLIGNTKVLDDERVRHRVQKLIPCDIMVDTGTQQGTEPDPNLSLVKQRTNGIPLAYDKYTRYNPHNNEIDRIAKQENILYCNRFMRSIHNYPVNYFQNSMYGAGRHFWGTPCEDFRVLWYGYSPHTTELMNRKIAIQHTIPDSDKAVGNGGQHLNLTEEVCIERFKYHQRFAYDLRDVIEELEG